MCDYHTRTESLWRGEINNEWPTCLYITSCTPRICLSQTLNHTASLHFQSPVTYMASNKVFVCMHCQQKYSDKSALLWPNKEHGKVTQGRTYYETAKHDIWRCCHSHSAVSDGIERHLSASPICGPTHIKWQNEILSVLPKCAWFQRWLPQ